VLTYPEKAALHATRQEDSLYTKIAWHIIPIFLISYIVAYLDRVNVGFAKLQMMGDLKFTDSVYGLGAGIFFVGYFVFEIPSNLILHKVGARVWLCRVLITWSIVSGCTALVQTPWQFYLCRFLLGLAEGGFFPGMVLYLTYWFPSNRRAKMMALLMAGNPISGIVGGPLSGYILHYFAHSTRIAAWQWLFIIESIPALVMGVIMFFYLDDRVAYARWLSTEEKEAVAAEIKQEDSSKTQRTAASVFTSPRVWLMCAILFMMGMGSYGIGFWQPTIIRQTGVKDPFIIGLLAMLPYSVALISMIVVGRHADKTRERRWHLAIPNLVASLGFVLCLHAGRNTTLVVAALTMAVVGVVTAMPMFWALPTSFLGDNAAAAGLALINCTGNLSGFLSPTIIGFLKTNTGSLNSGLYLVAACHIVAIVLILAFVPAKLVNR
jgi:D-galactonate transporter